MSSRHPECYLLLFTFSGVPNWILLTLVHQRWKNSHQPAADDIKRIKGSGVGLVLQEVRQILEEGNLDVFFHSTGAANRHRWKVSLKLLKKHELLNKTYPTDIKTIVILKNNKT